MFIYWESKDYNIRELAIVAESINAVDELYRIDNIPNYLSVLKESKKIDRIINLAGKRINNMKFRL